MTQSKEEFGRGTLTVSLWAIVALVSVGLGAQLDVPTSPAPNQPARPSQLSGPSALSHRTEMAGTAALIRSLGCRSFAAT